MSRMHCAKIRSIEAGPGDVKSTNKCGGRWPGSKIRKHFNCKEVMPVYKFSLEYKQVTGILSTNLNKCYRIPWLAEGAHVTISYSFPIEVNAPMRKKGWGIKFVEDRSTLCSLRAYITLYGFLQTPHPTLSYCQFSEC